MRPLIKRTFVVKQRKTNQGLETVVIDEVEAKPFVSPLEAGDRSGGTSSVTEAESVSDARRTGGAGIPSFSESF
jgi:hypothetical protein